MFLVLIFYLKIKELEDFSRLFGNSKLVPPYSQIKGEVVTHLVKILKLYQLVEEEASKSSLFFLSANQSPSLSSSLRLRNGGHKILVSARKRRGLSLD